MPLYHGESDYICERIGIEFSAEQLNELLEYQKELGVDTIQEAIMYAVRNMKCYKAI